MGKLRRTSSRTCQGISRREMLRVGGPSTLGLVLGGWQPSAHAYIGGLSITLGHAVNRSDYVMLAGVEEVDRDKGRIVCRKVRDLKCTWPSDIIR
jgi:hypothetical protein